MKKISRHAFMTIIGAAMVAAVLTACGTKATSAPAPSVAASLAASAASSEPAVGFDVSTVPAVVANGDELVAALDDFVTQNTDAFYPGEDYITAEEKKDSYPVISFSSPKYPEGDYGSYSIVIIDRVCTQPDSVFVATDTADDFMEKCGEHSWISEDGTVNYGQFASDCISTREAMMKATLG